MKNKQNINNNIIIPQYEYKIINYNQFEEILFFHHVYVDTGMQISTWTFLIIQKQHMDKNDPHTCPYSYHFHFIDDLPFI